MKRRAAVVLIVIMMLSLFVPAGAAYAQIETDEIELSAEGAVAIDADTAEVLYDKNMDTSMHPASTTKILTALVVLENMNLEDVVTVGPDAVGIEGSTLDLQEGEQLTVIDLLYGMLLKSTNDAAIALADACAGSVEAFAELMNAKAQEIGAVNSNFVTPNGLTDDIHYTTPYDLALVMRAAVNNPVFVEIMSTKEYTMASTWYSEERLVENSNRLLWDDTELEMDGETRTYKYDYLICGKTGYTSAAQYCLVEYAEKDDLDVITVTMHSTFEEQYPDAIRLLDTVFDRYEGLRILKEGTLIDKVYVTNGGKVDYTINKAIVACVEKDQGVSVEDYSWTVETRDDLVAPLPAGSEAGTLTLTKNGEEVAQYTVYTADEVKESGFRKFVDSFKASLFSKLIFVLLLFLVAVIIAGILMMRPSQKRAQRRKKRRLENADQLEERSAKRAAERRARRAKAAKAAEEEAKRKSAELEEQVRAEEERKRIEAKRALAAKAEREAAAAKAAEDPSGRGADTPEEPGDRE